MTAASEPAFWNVWSPDGLRIAYAAGFDMSLRSADGTGTPDVVSSSRTYPIPSSWSSDGRLLAAVERTPATQEDIWVYNVSDPKRPRQPFVQSPTTEAFPVFSPDGKWMAYGSNESGRAEVYVQPYPGPGARVQISTQGGNAPAWAGGGGEIVYVSSGESPQTVLMMAVAVKATATGLVVDTPRKLFEGRFAFTGPARGYDVTPDGRRFLMVQPRDAPPQPPVQLVLVENWFEELKRGAAR